MHCECCLNEPSSTKLMYDATQGFSLCKNCEENIKARVLLPLEWYRLIIQHGKEAEYINEKYYYTNGVSILPTRLREASLEYQLPKFDDVQHDLNKLIDFCWFPYADIHEQEKLAALSRFPIHDILQRFDTLIQANKRYHVGKIYELCIGLIHAGFKTEITAWIKNKWENKSTIAFRDLVAASTACLSQAEIAEIFVSVRPMMAYIFMSDEEGAEIYDPNSGASVVILQHGNNDFIQTQKLSTGPSVSEKYYGVETEMTVEPAYIPEKSLPLLSDKQRKSYLKLIDGNKIGGIPNTEKEYPGDDKKWNLLLQLSVYKLPFFSNFGDQGMEYVFIASDGGCARACFLWQG